VKVSDVRDDVADSTAYTFTNVNLPALGTAMSTAQSLGVNQLTRSPSNRAIVVVCHSEAAAVTWTVSSCSIGGVNGNKLVDRGGGTLAINTALFIWPANVLQGIANTNVVVTHSKAVTSCAIGVLSMENMRHVSTTALSSTFSDSSVSGFSHQGSGSCTLANANTGWTMIAGSTNDTGGGLEDCTWEARQGSSTNISGANQATHLYTGSNAEMSFSACYLVNPCYSANLVACGYGVDWSGAGLHEAAAFAIY
jgi:hypothetical protein